VQNENAKVNSYIETTEVKHGTKQMILESVHDFKLQYNTTKTFVSFIVDNCRVEPVSLL